MAEIKIEKKAPIWPWIIGLIVFTLIVYFLFFRDTTVVTDGTTTTNDTIVNQTEMQDTSDQNSSDVAAFVAFVKDDDGNMTLDHDYSHNALTKLIDATEEVASQSGYDSKMDLDKAREHADEITKNPEATDHSDHIKMSTDLISRVLQNLQQAKFPNLKAEADQTKMSSDAINVKELTLNQKGTIKAFFNDAADLLDKMN